MQITKAQTIKVVMIFFGFFLATAAFGAEHRLSSDEVKSLLSGNTAVSKHARDKLSYHAYYAPDGTYKMITDKGEKYAGTWRVESSGNLCVESGRGSGVTCGPLISLGNGSYKRMKQQQNILKPLMHNATIERVETGNTQGL